MDTNWTSSALAPNKRARPPKGTSRTMRTSSGPPADRTSYGEGGARPHQLGSHTFGMLDSRGLCYTLYTGLVYPAVLSPISSFFSLLTPFKHGCDAMR